MLLRFSGEDIAPHRRLTGEEEARQFHILWRNGDLCGLFGVGFQRRGGLGAQRAGYLEKDHDTQLALVARAIEGLEAQNLPPESLAREMLELAEQLRDDLADEEEMVLDDKLWGAQPEGAPGQRTEPK